MCPGLCIAHFELHPTASVMRSAATRSSSVDGGGIDTELVRELGQEDALAARDGLVRARHREGERVEIAALGRRCAGDERRQRGRLPQFLRNERLGPDRAARAREWPRSPFRVRVPSARAAAIVSRITRNTSGEHDGIAVSSALVHLRGAACPRHTGCGDPIAPAGVGGRPAPTPVVPGAGAEALVSDRLVQSPGHARSRQQRARVEERVAAAGQEAQRARAALAPAAEGAANEAVQQLFSIHVSISAPRRDPRCEMGRQGQHLRRRDCTRVTETRPAMFPRQHSSRHVRALPGRPALAPRTDRARAVIESFGARYITPTHRRSSEHHHARHSRAGHESYLAERSAPAEQQYLVHLPRRGSRTSGPRPHNSISREWVITDSDGNEQRVLGPGSRRGAARAGAGRHVRVFELLPDEDPRRLDARVLSDGHERRRGVRCPHRTVHAGGAERVELRPVRRLLRPQPGCRMSDAGCRMSDAGMPDLEKRWCGLQPAS